MNNLKESNESKIDNTIERLARCVECLCCFPITIYGLYLACKNPLYKYEPILDRPTIDALVDHYI